jgi:hypothetical protein
VTALDTCMYIIIFPTLFSVHSFFRQAFLGVTALLGLTTPRRRK